MLVDFSCIPRICLVSCLGYASWFSSLCEVRQASLSRANTGLALFGAGREDEARLMMEKAAAMHGNASRKDAQDANIAEVRVISEAW